MEAVQKTFRFEVFKNPKCLKELMRNRTDHIHTRTVVMDLVESAMGKIKSCRREDLSIKERAAVGALVKSRHANLPNPLFNDIRGDTFTTEEERIYYDILRGLKRREAEL